MTRQEFVDAVAEVVGLSPLQEMKVQTIAMLADSYAADHAIDQVARALALVAKDQPGSGSW